MNYEPIYPHKMIMVVCRQHHSQRFIHQFLLCHCHCSCWPGNSIQGQHISQLSFLASQSGNEPLGIWSNFKLHLANSLKSSEKSTKNCQSKADYWLRPYCQVIRNKRDDERERIRNLLCVGGNLCDKREGHSSTLHVKLDGISYRIFQYPTNGKRTAPIMATLYHKMNNPGWIDRYSFVQQQQQQQ